MDAPQYHRMQMQPYLKQTSLTSILHIMHVMLSLNARAIIHCAQSVQLLNVDWQRGLLVALLWRRGGRWQCSWW